MACAAGPDISENGLVLTLDAGNSKGFDAYENLLTYSEQFDNAIYGIGNGSISTNLITAPDGNTTADAFIENTTSNAYHFFNQSITKSASSITYTFSIFVKSKGGRRVGLRIESGGAGVISEFNVVAGTIAVSAATYNIGFSSVSSTIDIYPNDWYRITLTATSNTSTSLFVQLYLVSNVTNSSVYTGDGTSGIYIWGAQLETSSLASPYYPTTASAKNRGTTLTDLSGRGNNGTLVNGPTYSSANGGSLVFDGVDDYVSFTSNPSLTNQMSAEVWVKLNDPQGVNASGLILGRENSYRMLYSSSAIDWICATTNNGWYTTGTAITAGSVTPFSSTLHIVATYDGVNNKIYINGTLRTTGSLISGDVLTSGTYYLMRTTAGNVDYGQGNIYSHKIYNRALTAQEIQQNFIATKGRYGI
jgi:hypothetical protein